MTYVLVDIHHKTHTCPADPHPYDTTRTVIACGRHEPPYRQCPACRVTVTQHTITTEFMGHHGPARTETATRIEDAA
jgi:hypothetical protein